MNAVRRTLLALAAATLSTGALAQAWPSKPIKVIVPFPPGGGTDLIARAVTQKVATATNWTFVVENRPGAGGNLGVDAVAKSPADGYTLVLGQTSNLAINPSLYAKLPYDPQKDLAPIILVANAPLVMVTSAGSPFKTLGDVVKAAKEKPGRVNFASPGNGTVAHLASELFQKAADVKMQHVPYKGFDAGTWFGLLAPAATPKDVVSKLNAEFNKALQQPDLRKKLGDEGADPLGGTSEQFATLIKDDMVRWSKVVKESGAKVD